MSRTLFRLLCVAAAAAFAQAAAQPRVLRLPGVPAEATLPDVPVTEADPAFPLRAHIFTARWGGLGRRNHGYGTLNLLDPKAPRGFDYAFECYVPFTLNEAPSDTYQARWKREPYQLEILTGDLAGKHARTCTLHLAPEARPFDGSNGARLSHGVSSSLRVVWHDPDFAYETPDPEYPVQFHVLDAQRTEGPSEDRGWGTANLSDLAPGKGLEGAEFEYECRYGFLPNTQVDTYYQARWVKPDEQLEVLLQRAGSDKVDRCKVSVALRPQPYPDARAARVGRTP